MVKKVIIKLHLFGIYRRLVLFLVNKIFCGTKPKYFEIKRKLLISIGYKIGENTKIVAPIECSADLYIGSNCWIGKNLMVNGNGTVIIGDNCDIAPEVAFLTGGHKIGNEIRRAGLGETYKICVGDGVWIGSRSTILNSTTIGKSSVIAACACVTKDVEENVVVGGVPAKVIKEIADNA